MQQVLGTYNGSTVFSVPSDWMTGVEAPSSIEWNPYEVVAANASPFTGQVQVYDWQTSWWEGTVSFPPMKRQDADVWSAFILSCRGLYNTFLLGDPKGATPKGTALGSPVVSGANQMGYVLQTRGWTPNQTTALLIGDYISIPIPGAAGYRLYKVTRPVVSDANGSASVSIWPNLRDAPADGTAITTNNCKGLFRLAQPSGNKFSTSPGMTNYGFTGLQIREAL